MVYLTVRLRLDQGLAPERQCLIVLAGRDCSAVDLIDCHMLLGDIAEKMKENVNNKDDAYDQPDIHL